MTAVNHTELPFDEILERRIFPTDVPPDGEIICRIMQDGWEIGTWTETGYDGTGPVARKILAVNDLLAVCKALAERRAVIATTGLGEQLDAAIAKAEGIA